MRLYLLLIFLSSVLFANAQVNANAGPDMSICMRDTMKVSGKGLSFADTGTYQWRDIVLNKIVSINAFLSIRSTDTNAKYFELEVTRTSKGVTYSDLDTLKLITFALTTFISKATTIRNFYLKIFE